MNTVQASVTIAVIALATLLTRAAPFLLFPNAKKTPPFVQYLGRVLPHAMMGMLVVYCLKDVKVTQSPHGLPEPIAILCAAGLHLRRRNVILSIAGATILYMILIRVL